MKLRHLTYRIVALSLAVGLGLPSHAFGLRMTQSVQSGLEEEIVEALGRSPSNPAAGLEEQPDIWYPIDMGNIVDKNLRAALKRLKGWAQDSGGVSPFQLADQLVRITGRPQPEFGVLKRAVQLQLEKILWLTDGQGIDPSVIKAGEPRFPVLWNALLKLRWMLEGGLLGPKEVREILREFGNSPLRVLEVPHPGLGSMSQVGSALDRFLGPFSESAAYLLGSFLEDFPRSDTDLHFLIQLPADVWLLSKSTWVLADFDWSNPLVKRVSIQKVSPGKMEVFERGPRLSLRGDQVLIRKGEQWFLKGADLARLFRRIQKKRDVIRRQAQRSGGPVSELEITRQAAQEIQAKLNHTAGLEEDSETSLEPLAVRIRPLQWGRLELSEVAAIEELKQRLGAEKWGLEDFRRYRRGRRESTRVAEHEKRIVGFLVYQEVYSEEDESGPMELEAIQILNLGVHPDFQGQGVERHLIEWLILEFRRRHPLVSFSFTNHVLDEQDREPFLNLGFKARLIPDHFGEGEDAFELVLRPTDSERAHPNAVQLAAEWDRLQRFGGEKQIRNAEATFFLEADSVQMRARYVVGFLAEISHRRQILEGRNRKVIPSVILHAPEVRDFLRLITQSTPAVRKMARTLRWMRKDPSLAPVVSRLKETLTWLTEAASRSRSRTVEPASKNLNLLLKAVTGTEAQGQVGPSIPPGQPPSAPEGQNESAGLEEGRDRLETIVNRLAEAAQEHPGVLVITQGGLEEQPGLIRLARYPEFARRMILFSTLAAAQLAKLQELGVRVIQEGDFEGLVLALLSMKEADRVTVLEEAGILTQALARVLPPP